MDAMVAIVLATFGAGCPAPLTLSARPRVRVGRVADDTRSSAPALRLFLLSRAAIWLLAVVVVVGFDGALNARRGEWDSSRLHDLGAVIDVWARWDSDWFLRIAEDGYSWPSSTPAFFPLYPLLVAGLGTGLRRPRRARRRGHLARGRGRRVRAALPPDATCVSERTTARRTVLFLAVAPTSLFFGAVYSESLFLLLAVATFLLAERGRFWQAGAAAGLALLTRSAGVALLPALVVLAWRAPNRLRACGVALAPLLFALYPLVLAIWIDRPLAFLDAQKVVWERRLSPAGPLGGIVAAVQHRELLDLAVARSL